MAEFFMILIAMVIIIIGMVAGVYIGTARDSESYDKTYLWQNYNLED